MKIKEINYLEEKVQQRLFQLQEPPAFYNYGQKKINKYHDKTFKNLFSNKKEAVIFINKYLKLKDTKNELNSNQIEKCNTEFITKQKEQLETDILYRIKGTKIFILIEQQSKVDYFMPKRILYYYVEIMREIEKENESTNTNEKLPIIYPMVLYTGRTKWTAKTEITEMQEEIIGLEKALMLSYCLVDINNLTKEELIKERSSIAKAILLEKIRNKEELLENLERIVKEDLTVEEIRFMLDLLTNVVTEEIGNEKAKKLRKMISMEVNENMVTENLRNIFRMNYNEGIEIGIKKGILETARELLKFGMNKEDIQKVTKLTKKEIEKL